LTLPACISPSSKGSIRLDLQSFKAPMLLGLCCFLVYNANLRQIGAGDTMPARYLPLILWHNGTLELDANARLVAHGHSMVPPWKRNQTAGADGPGSEGNVNYFEPWAYWMVRTRQNQLASLYPVVTPLLVAPLYLPAVIWLNKHGWEQPQIDRVAVLMEKISASFLASLASVLMFLVLRRDCIRWSLPLALAFAFGTNTWMISSQGLWQHGSGELLIALSLLLVVPGERGPASPMRTALLGAVCVLMAANRPPDALIAGAIVLFVVWNSGQGAVWSPDRRAAWNRRRSALWLLAGAVVPLAALLYYNLVFIGNPAGGYGMAPSKGFVHLNLSGMAGLLVSPARGLLVFSPFLVFIPVGLIQRLRAPGSRGLAVALSLAAAAQFIVYSQADWRAGASWGPRWLTDLLPILVWMLAPFPLVLRAVTNGATRVLLSITMTAAMALSVGVQTIGAFWYTGASDARIFAGGPASMSGAWDPGNVPFLTELQHPRARGEILCHACGWIDRVGQTLLPGIGDVPVLENGEVIEGWTLTCGHTPAQVLVLMDGILIGSTQDFLPRPDVSNEMHTLSPTGWRVSANTRGVSPGERVLQVAVRIEPSSDIRIVREQLVFVVTQEPPGNSATVPQQFGSGSELDAMAAQAAQAAQAAMLLRARQSRYGFWLTSYTQGLRYEAPQQEMNTYLTAMLVDVLSPVARQRNLDDVVDRARRHLAAQIESNGLVRYHGLPTGPTIGTLGCVITPDADDTALVWRIAGSSAGDPQRQVMLQLMLQLMLGELAHYRDARGLYRTWLAPQNQYQCIDPGSDPNPADIAINMHMYLMLRERNPPAAQNLCNALQRSFGDDNIWVYYKRTPLVPYLRTAELRQLGCAIPLPTERLALSAAGQEIWSEAVRLLAETSLDKTMPSPPDANVRKEIDNLLVRIGSDDFAQVRRSPPLLYHNDLSATVPRFYWSEDFGYALWLRLYEAVRVEPGQLNRPLQ
jgi:hypothetical protein